MIQTVYHATDADSGFNYLASSEHEARAIAEENDWEYQGKLSDILPEIDVAVVERLLLADSIH